MPEQVLSDEKQPAEKPFPWRCPKCRQPTVNRVTMPYRCQRTHNGRIVTVEVPNLAVPRCSNCGEVVFDYAADEQIRSAFRTQFSLAETAMGENHMPVLAAMLSDQFSLAETAMGENQTHRQSTTARLKNNISKLFLSLLISYLIMSFSGSVLLVIISGKIETIGLAFLLPPFWLPAVAVYIMTSKKAWNGWLRLCGFLITFGFFSIGLLYYIFMRASSTVDDGGLEMGLGCCALECILAVFALISAKICETQERRWTSDGSL